MDKATFREQYSEDPKREDLTTLVPKQDDPTEQVPGRRPPTRCARNRAGHLHAPVIGLHAP